MLKLNKHARWYNWLIYSILDPEIEDALKKYATGRMLDVGCGVKPYLETARPYVVEHVGLDQDVTIHDRSNVDLSGSACGIPADDHSFDTVLCTEVLEHIEDPGLALAEACRVLKPGGYGIYTVPLFWHIHEEPRDFYRYTRFGLEHLFEKSGFEVVGIKALSGFVVTFAQELVYFLLKFRRGGPINPLWWVVPPLSMVIQGAAYLLRGLDHSVNFTIEYIAIVRKKRTAIVS